MKLQIRDIAFIGMMIAILEVSKRVLDFIPNVELISFWIIMFTIFFKKKTIFAIYGFVLLEGFVFGFHIWWVMYLYIWPLLAIVTWLFRKSNSVLIYAVISSMFGFLFGAICSIPYIFIGATDGNLAHGLHAGFTWWIAGIPWDIIHGISNFIIMLVLYVPIKRIMEKMQRQLQF